MHPHAPLVVALEPHEQSADTVKPLLLPWSGQQVTIRVPAGTPDGTVLRIPGLGHPAVPGGPPQDGFVQIRITPAAGQFGPAPVLHPPSPYGPPPVLNRPPSFGPPPTPHTAPLYGPPPVPYSPVLAGDARPAGATRRNVLIGGAVVLVLLAGCCAMFRLISADKPDATSPDGAPAAGATPLAPEAYQAALTTADTTLAARLHTLTAAKSPKRVQSSTDAMKAAVEQQRAALASVAAPTPVAGAHQKLMAALAAFGASFTADDVTEACLGPAAASSLSRTRAADDLRAVAKSLSTTDPAHAYRFGSFVPRATTGIGKRPANGKFVTRTGSGLGRLEVTNGSDDSAVSLVRKGSTKPIVRVYLRGGKKFTVTDIPDGTYQVFMTNGSEWDSTLKAFGRDCAFQKFDDTIKFTSGGGVYSIWKITITAVVGGNASSSDVDPEAFPD